MKHTHTHRYNNNTKFIHENLCSFDGMETFPVALLVRAFLRTFRTIRARWNLFIYDHLFGHKTEIFIHFLKYRYFIFYTGAVAGGNLDSRLILEVCVSFILLLLLLYIVLLWLRWHSTCMRPLFCISLGHLIFVFINGPGILYAHISNTHTHTHINAVSFDSN